MNRLSTETRTLIVRCLVDGNSVRATSRITGVSKNTVTKLLCELGEACRAYHDEHVTGLDSRRIQCDEIWSFVHTKDKNLTLADRATGEKGSMWTWTAIDADSKLIVSYLIGTRETDYARTFMHDVASRLTNRVQLTTDGHQPYVAAVDEAFADDVDFAMLVKEYGDSGDGLEFTCTGIHKQPVSGYPEEEHVSTSHVERQNLTMRMGMRRFTRLTNGFSKKVANHEAALSLYFAHYNFCRVHQTLQVTPAMQAGLSTYAWDVEELLALIPDPKRAAWGSLARAA